MYPLPKPLQGQRNRMILGYIAANLDPCGVEHPLGRDDAGGHAVFVIRIHHFPDSGLNDCLCTFVAREKCHENRCPFQTSSPVIEDCVELAVGGVEVLVVLPLSLPGEFIIGASGGKAVISHGQNLVLRADDAGSHLCIRVLGPHCGKHCDPHKIFVPADKIFSL